MNLTLLANLSYILILAIMAFSALWVLADSRKRGKPWADALAWSLFAGCFFGIGLIIYLFWTRKYMK